MKLYPLFCGAFHVKTSSPNLSRYLRSLRSFFSVVAEDVETSILILRFLGERQRGTMTTLYLRASQLPRLSALRKIDARLRLRAVDPIHLSISDPWTLQARRREFPDVRRAGQILHRHNGMLRPQGEMLPTVTNLHPQEHSSREPAVPQSLRASVAEPES